LHDLVKDESNWKDEKGIQDIQLEEEHLRDQEL